MSEDGTNGAGEIPHENPNRPREYHGLRTLAAGAGAVAAVGLALWLALLRPGPTAEGGVAELPDYLRAGGQEVGASVGNLAPDFELETLAGGRFRLSDWRGRPVIVNFWASWCGPCRREMPALIRAQDAHAEQGLTIVGVNIEESRGPAGEFADEFGIDFVAPMDFSGAVFRAYGGGGPAGPPRTFFIDPDGVVVQIYAGQAPDERIAADAAAHAERYGAEDVDAGIPYGLKAPPLSEATEGVAVGIGVGEVAPDFVLAARSTGERFRLSDARGEQVLLIVAAPGCIGCGRRVAEAADLIGGAPRSVLLSAEALEGLGGVAVDTDLVWRRAVGQVLVGGGDLRFIVIDPAGLIATVSSDPAELDVAALFGVDSE